MMRTRPLMAVLLLIASACGAQTPALPTLMVLPSAAPELTATLPFTETPTSAPSVSPTLPPTATLTETPERLTDLEQHAVNATLYPQLAAVEGVETLDLVSRMEGALYLEVRVQSAFDRVEVAEALLAAGQQLFGDLQDFGAILSESASATDYTWNGQRDTWTITPLTQFPLSTSTAAAAAFSLTCNGMDDLNCADFPRNRQAAQAHLMLCGNEDRLDGDDDGRACEFGV